MVRPCVARGIFDLADVGLASMYPASIWSFLLRAIMDISALKILLPARPQVWAIWVTSFRQRREDRFLHFIIHSRRPRRETVRLIVVRSWQFLCSIRTVPSPRPCSATHTARAGLVRIGRRNDHSTRHDVARPYLDKVEHDAILRPVRALDRLSLSPRSRGL